MHFPLQSHHLLQTFSMPLICAAYFGFLDGCYRIRKTKPEVLPSKTGMDILFYVLLLQYYGSYLSGFVLQADIIWLCFKDTLPGFLCLVI